MFAITEKDKEIFESVLETFPMPKEAKKVFKETKVISVKKEKGWYYVTLHTGDKDQPYLKSTILPMIQIKMVKYFSGCNVLCCPEVSKELVELEDCQ